MNPGSHKEEVLFVTSYPPRECGIATYSQDLMRAISEKFGNSISLKVAALESENNCKYSYGKEVKFVLQTTDRLNYIQLAGRINNDEAIKLVFIQHEFGLYSGKYGEDLLYFLVLLNKDVLVTFHSVLPDPDEKLACIVREIVRNASGVVVMTGNSSEILRTKYGIDPKRIHVIPHGTHLIRDYDAENLKLKYFLKGKKVLSTFGLLSPGKSIETALDALPAVIEKFPDVIYLVLGRMHPALPRQQSDSYKKFLSDKVAELNLSNHVRFVDYYLELEVLLEYLQLTDLYLFISRDPNQAVSGTFVYALSCGCPVVSTPIPHALELRSKNAGILFDFNNHTQLSDTIIRLLENPELQKGLSLNALHYIRPTCWQNTAIAHAKLFWNQIRKIENRNLKFNIPDISLDHIRHLSTPAGIIQFAKLSKPDPDSGYSLDDNARALIAMIWHHETTRDRSSLKLAEAYLNFIVYSQCPDGKFMNYIDINGEYYTKNNVENLEDSNARAVWALGEFISRKHFFCKYHLMRAQKTMDNALEQIRNLHSPRAAAFAIKGLYRYNQVAHNGNIKKLIEYFADSLLFKYREISDHTWSWFENYLTYANSVLPEALLYAYQETGNRYYMKTAVQAMDFLISIIFKDNQIRVVSNKGWYVRGKSAHPYGEQPIDVSYTILALDLFYRVTGEYKYKDLMGKAFSWFHGNNHLGQIIYNPVTGGCYDGLEEDHVNLNQGAESTVCYLMAGLIMEKNRRETRKAKLFKRPKEYTGRYKAPAIDVKNLKYEGNPWTGKDT